MTVDELRGQFPQLSEKIYGKDLVYLDNAATSQRPLGVISKWEDISTRCNANLHRAVHRLAELATEEFESTRKEVSRSINASSEKEIVFTSGATQSVNMAAFSLGESVLGEGDEIIIGEDCHHSSIVPWQMVCERKGTRIKVLPVDECGRLRAEMLPEIISSKTKLLCISHISNVLGIITPIREIGSFCREKGILLFVDGAQGIVHDRVDVQSMMCDFYAFSGHKVYAAPGTGVLYGRYDILKNLPPYMGGGEMIDTVTWKKTTYAPVPHRFEAGTQNIAGIPTLKPALELARKIAEDGEINGYGTKLKEFVYEELTSRKDIKLYGKVGNLTAKAPVFSFTADGVHHEDLALILDKMGIAVRSGQMCAEPLMDRFQVTGMLRASFAPYNTMEEAEYFIASLDKAIKMLK